MKNQTAENIRITVNALKLFGVVVDVVRFAPGDGWTRYSVTVNGWHDIHNGMTAAECHAYLSGMFDMLRVQQNARLETPTPTPNAIDSALAARHYMDKEDDPGHGPNSPCEICRFHQYGAGSMPNDDGGRTAAGNEYNTDADDATIDDVERDAD